MSESANARDLLEILLRIVGDSDEYFVSGSLSFLPLIGGYREPAHDVDASLELRLFQDRRSLMEQEGTLRALRLTEVAVAESSPLARVLAPRTDFVHLETPKGLLDLQRVLGYIDWDFASYLLTEGRVRWLGRELPDAVDRRLNPFRSLDLHQLRDAVTATPRQQPDEDNRAGP